MKASNLGLTFIHATKHLLSFYFCQALWAQQRVDKASAFSNTPMRCGKCECTGPYTISGSCKFYEEKRSKVRGQAATEEKKGIVGRRPENTWANDLRKRKKRKYKDPEAKVSLDIFRGTARRSVWLQNKLKRQRKDKSRGRMGSIHWGPSGSC